MSTVADLPRLNLSQALEAFCRKWKIVRLEAFGSILREDFGPTSDVDLLATFADDAHWGHQQREMMEQELVALIGRPVDLIAR